jgi:hypothetical protein
MLGCHRSVRAIAPPLQAEADEAQDEATEPLSFLQRCLVVNILVVYTQNGILTSIPARSLQLHAFVALVGQKRHELRYLYLLILVADLTARVNLASSTTLKTHAQRMLCAFFFFRFPVSAFNTTCMLPHALNQ